MKSVLSHVALLVPDAIKSANFLRQFDFKIGPTEDFEGEGTREIYIGNLESQMGSLLLMEPIKDGAYTRAMTKRGPGLHHVAIDVINLESYIGELSGSGWLLHPKSLKTIKHSQTAYLARPDVPTLIEVQQKEDLSELPLFIQSIALPMLSEKALKMFQALGLNDIQPSKNQDMIITINKKEIIFKDLLNG